MGQYESISDQLGLMIRMIVPYSFIFVICLLNIIAVPYPLAIFFQAPLILMMIYYWSVYRPTVVPPWLVCMIGLGFDVIMGMPYLGLNAALLLISRLIIVDQRRFLTGQSFPMVWLGFIFLDAIYHLLQWALFSILSFEFVPLHDLGTALVLGVFVFPVIYAFLNLSHKFVPPQLSKTPGRLGSQKSNLPI